MSEPSLSGQASQGGFVWRFPKVCGKLTLIGRSRAADSTGFTIPELKIGLDAGCVAHGQKPRDVFVTHTHTDHCCMLTHFVSRTHPPHFYVPHHAVDLVERYLRSAQELTNNAPFDTPCQYECNHILVGVLGQADPTDTTTTTPSSSPSGREGLIFNADTPTPPSPHHDTHQGYSTIRFSRGRRRLEVRVYKMSHSVPCIAYGFNEYKSVLKPSLRGRSTTEISTLKRAGEEITQDILVPLFVFCGDTTAQAFHNTPEILQRYPVVITECSFLDDSLATKARESCHTLWSELKPLVTAHPDTVFVLIHFSHHYAPGEIQAFFAQQGLVNVHPMVQDGDEGMVFGSTRGEPRVHSSPKH